MSNLDAFSCVLLLPPAPVLRVAVVGDFQPTHHFVVDIADCLEWNAVRDSIFFREAAGVNQPAFGFHVSQRKTYVDSLRRGGLDLREHVIAIQGNNGLAGTSLHVLADL